MSIDGMGIYFAGETSAGTDKAGEMQRDRKKSGETPARMGDMRRHQQ